MASNFEKYKPLVFQLIKFGMIGVLNTVVDYVILLILSKITGITSGNGIIPLNIISFSIATVNSYFLNKLWTFSDKSRVEQARKFSLFLIVSIVGVIINTVIVRVITTNVPIQLNLTPREWLIAAKLAATGVSLIWNFVGYKLFVFKK